MQLLRDNLTLWTSSDGAEGEGAAPKEEKPEEEAAAAAPAEEKQEEAKSAEAES